jgi:hypothetical protein
MKNPNEFGFDTFGELIAADAAQSPPTTEAFIVGPEEKTPRHEWTSQEWQNIAPERRGSIRASVQNVAWKGITHVLNWLNNANEGIKPEAKPLTQPDAQLSRQILAPQPPQHTPGERGYHGMRHELPLPGVSLRMRNHSHEE